MQALTERWALTSPIGPTSRLGRWADAEHARRRPRLPLNYHEIKSDSHPRDCLTNTSLTRHLVACLSRPSQSPPIPPETRFTVVPKMRRRKPPDLAGLSEAAVRTRRAARGV